MDKWAIVAFAIFFAANLLVLEQTGVFLYGQSTVNVNNIVNLVSTGSFAFEPNYLLNYNHTVSEDYDFVLRGGKYYSVVDPFFMFYAMPFLIFSDVSVRSFSSMLVFLISLCAAFALVVFYEVCRILGLKEKTSFLASLAAGFGTGWIIYSRTIVSMVPSTLFFLLALKHALLFRNSGKKRDFVVFSVFASMMVLNRLANLIFIIPFFLLSKEFLKKERVTWFLAIFLVSLVPRLWWYHSTTGSIFLDPHFYYNKMGRTVQGLCIEYPNMVPGNFYEAYRYTNSSDGYYRMFSNLFYSFRNFDGVFLNSHGIFTSMFSEYGFVFNSLFILFSIIGAFWLWKKDKKIAQFIGIVLAMNLFLYGFYAMGSKGGTGPRYTRYYLPSIFLLVFLSFYFFEKDKSIWKWAFVALVAISILNCTSLAIHNHMYESPEELFSVDLMVWPW